MMANYCFDWMLDHDAVEYVRGYAGSYAGTPYGDDWKSWRRAFERIVQRSRRPEEMRAWHERGIEGYLRERASV